MSKDTKKILVVRVGGDDYATRPDYAVIFITKGLVRRLKSKMAQASKDDDDTTLSCPDFSPEFVGDGNNPLASFMAYEQHEAEDSGSLILKVPSTWEIPPGSAARLNTCRLNASKSRVWWEAYEKHCDAEIHTYSLLAADIKRMEKAVR
jgi:hypothetical protein